MRRVRLSAATLTVALVTAACSSGQTASDTVIGTAPEPDTTTTLDEELAEFPPLYQDFINESGGSKWVDVNGSKMHYVEAGDPDGEVVLLGHGAPVNSFLWRDIIGELATPDRRVIAFDLIGYGRSEHPDLDYSFETQSEYMTGFIEALDLENVNLVLHDVSGQAGFGYAAAFPENVASITSMEVMYRSFENVDEMGPFAGPFFSQVQQPGVGEQLIIEQNFAVVENLDAGTASDLDPEIRETYGWFFTDPESRDVVLEFIRSTPIAGEPVAAAAFIDGYAKWLTENEIPKLAINPQAGIVPSVQFETAQSLPNIKTVEIPDAGHFAQEDNPTVVAEIINEFYEELGI